jgi:hypothetical protein
LLFQQQLLKEVSQKPEPQLLYLSFGFQVLESAELKLKAYSVLFDNGIAPKENGTCAMIASATTSNMLSYVASCV